MRKRRRRNCEDLIFFCVCAFTMFCAVGWWVLPTPLQTKYSRAVVKKVPVEKKVSVDLLTHCFFGHAFRSFLFSFFFFFLHLAHSTHLFARGMSWKCCLFFSPPIIFVLSCSPSLIITRVLLLLPTVIPSLIFPQVLRTLKSSTKPVEVKATTRRTF